jgi:PHP family Zn ribbon phosphoesterase
MNNCDLIQRKLVSAEELLENERHHLEACPDCGTFFETQVSIESAATAHRILDASPLPRRPSARPPYLRLAFVSLALLGCLTVAAAFMVQRLDSLDRDAAGQRLLSLLDEVGAIADAQDVDEVQLVSDSTLSATQEFFEKQEEEQEEDQVSLPPTYEYLEEALSNNWL